MSNPYSVLGVPTNSTDEQIKTAYLDLVEKYSPVNYTGNPLADVAQDKLKEVNDAYDQIMSERRVGPSSGQWQSTGNANTSSHASQGSAAYGSESYTYGNEYAEIRRMINANNYAAAENALLSISVERRNAEWNYLMGRVCQAKGWLDQAGSYYDAAAKAEPTNPDYATAAANFAARRTPNSNGQYNRGYNTSTPSSCGGCSGCDICSSLVCADCCCECMGGDLIRCC